MSRKTTLNIDNEMEAALAALIEIDGTQSLAIKRAVVEQANRLKQRESILEELQRWQDEYGAFDPADIEWADQVLDRQGVPRHVP